MSENELTTDKIAGEMNALVQDAEALLEATSDHTDSRIAEIRHRLSGAVANARVTCKDLQGRATAQVRRGLEQTDATVRSHPWESVGLAFFAGLVVGALVGRR